MIACIKYLAMIFCAKVFMLSALEVLSCVIGLWRENTLQQCLDKGQETPVCEAK